MKRANPPATSQKVRDLSQLSELRAAHPGARIVHCHGVFDIIHSGHLSYFESARKFGDILVVTITEDKNVNKGPGRPYFNEVIRANMVAALEVVDYVAISRYSTAVPIIETIKPHFYVKGPDYRDKTKDVTGAIYEEEFAAEKFGGKLVFTDDDTFSSSTLANKFFMQWSEDQQKVIDLVKQEGGEATIKKVLDKISALKVSVIGEPIVDTYVFCNPESISSKSPSVSARYMYEEDYTGGSLAIANHLADFVQEVNLYIAHGGEPYFRELLEKKLDPRIKLHEVVLPNVPTPRKTRYIAIDKSQRIFEITNLRNDQWSLNKPDDFLKLIREVPQKSDVILLADFGHGLFEGPVLQAVGEFNQFVGLNVQTNSSNYGFNPCTRHKHFSFLVLDTREARIAHHDRITAPVDLGRRLYMDMRDKDSAVALTLGSHGSHYFPPHSDNEYSSPAFTDSVVDATGAGDAYFALVSLLLKAQCPHVMLPFLGNVFAGLKTKIIGNKSSVTKAQFVKAVTSILK